MVVRMSCPCGHNSALSILPVCLCACDHGLNQEAAVPSSRPLMDVLLLESGLEQTNSGSHFAIVYTKLVLKAASFIYLFIYYLFLPGLWKNDQFYFQKT